MTGAARRPVVVAGGSRSISADFDRLGQLAATLAAVATALLDAAGAAIRAAAEPALLSAAVFDPVGAAEVAERALLSASTAALAAAGAETAAGGLRLAVAGYQAADTIDSSLGPVVAALAALPATAAALPTLARGLTGHDPALLQRGLTTIIERDPQLIAPVLDLVSSGSPTLMLAGLLSPSPASSSVVGAARTLAALYPDGRPVLTRRVNSPAEAADPPPRGLRDVVVDLGHLNESAADGGVAVRFVSTTAADGSTSRRAIVEVTGTKNWDLRPGMHRAITDIGTNLRAVAGAPTAYAVGVVQAMREAGIKPGEPVMLVGHSQGGMVAAEVAAGLAGSSQFHITHLVTAGSPIGHIALPPSVQTLSLENRQDIVPLVDGRDNPRTSTQLTVGVDEGSPVDAAGFGARHDLLSAYAPGAADVEASSDPSIRDWLDGADGFFGGDAVRTVSYDVHRHR